ncbi:hypothetical protein H4CHR_00784 [Variovorax sp. PBS-H4]|uniref:hypothetical protein n=1 Tax=Variovorax sp. PBS-H4 TaxID=434008 RepID=UPI00131756A9|nr:hypothetical protein [Variovorax sp. PBS-H4]VTU21423.1 hypothetical protein H4CHR_00784 [Variovorax sp. PBS-H4]
MHTLSKSAQLRPPVFRSNASASQTLQARAGQQTRHYVSWSVLMVLQRGPWAAALVRNFQFQRPGDCVTNSEVMQHNVLQALSRQRQVEIAAGKDKGGGLLQQLQQVFGVAQAPELEREYRHDPTVNDVVELVEQHGPCVLSLARILPADQGGTQYAGHHAVLVIGTFKVEGRNWAVALDGNDLQNHPFMERVHAYADKYHHGALEALTEGDLSAIQMEMKQAGESWDSIQLVYSLIDLDKAVVEADKASRAYEADLSANGSSDLPPITFPNSICVTTNATVKAGPLPEPMKHELACIVGSQPDSLSRLKVRAAPEEL